MDRIFNSLKKIECQEDLNTASEYLRMAVPLMIQRRIPPTPYNYALWYAHVQNQNPELSRALLEQFPGPGSYNPEKSESLFFKFFIGDDLSNRPNPRQEPEEGRSSARLDALTRIANRRAFDDVINQSLSMTDEPTCLLMLDLDHCKPCNDADRHLMSERMLEIVGGILAELQSETVFVARYGGESFAVILHDRLAVAQDLAATLRQRVSAIPLKPPGSAELVGTILISIGLVQAGAGDTPQTLVERAGIAARLSAV